MEPNRQDDMMQNWRQRGRVVRAPDLNIRRSRVEIPFWPPADHDVVLGSPEFNFSATLVNSQLVCLPPVGIFNLVMFIWILIYRCLHWSWKAPMGSGQLSIHFFFYIFFPVGRHQLGAPKHANTTARQKNISIAGSKCLVSLIFPCILGELNYLKNSGQSLTMSSQADLQME